MLVNLYASRVILKHLGITDFGIYNVVGGFVSMFSIISNALTTGITRFITFEIGSNNLENLKKVFSTSVIIQIIISLILLVLVETFGVWFLNNHMTIPSDRMVAANWVLQFSAITFCINLISIPFTADLIAHEHMKIYAYITIADAILKLAICFLLSYSPIDYLVTYSILMMMVAVTIRFTYSAYCSSHFEECKFQLNFDKKYFWQMASFSGWNMIGSSSAVLRDYGVNVLINIFYGPIANAARGIAMQVSNAVQCFSNSFIMAINPQITKSYAANKVKESIDLAFWGSRITYYLLFLIALPFLIETKKILQIWLSQVPQYSIIFVRLIVIYVLAECVSYTLVTLMLATGKIRNYQIVVGGCQMLNFPISYFILYKGASPELTIAISILIALLCLMLRLYMLKRMIGLPILDYCKSVLANCLVVSIVSLIPPFVIRLSLENEIIQSLLTFIICIGSVVLSIAIVGLNKVERIIVFKFIKNKLKITI